LVEVDELRRLRREVEELKDDLSRVAKDLLSTTVRELEDVASFVHSGDFSDLAKRLLRNTNTIIDMLVQLESARDFVKDATPLARALMNDTLGSLDDFDKKGYFDKGREMARALDNIVAEFSIEDVQQLANNATTILHTIKSLTQPEMLEAADNAIEIYRKIDFNTIEEYSPF